MNETINFNDNLLINRYSIKEEIFNSITHGIGALLSIVGLVVLVSFGAIKGDIWRIISFSIYGFTLFFLYLSSTLYHSIFHEKSKQVLRILDHVAIYLVIAGSYTPIALVPMRGPWGWIIFAAIWSLAIVGITLKIFSSKSRIIKYFSTISYIVMGWLIVFALKPMLNMVPWQLFGWLLAGGLIYTTGVIFYKSKRIPYNHGIWHLFVLAGSAIHFLGILLYLT